MRTLRALFSVAITIFFLFLPNQAYGVLLPHGTSATDGKTSRYIITFKDGVQADIAGVASWLQERKIGIYIRPLFTVQTVGPSFVGLSSPVQSVAQQAEQRTKAMTGKRVKSLTDQLLSYVIRPVWAQMSVVGDIIPGYRTRPPTQGAQLLGEVSTLGTTSLSGRWQSVRACGGQFPIAPGLQVSGYLLDQCNPAGDPAYSSGIMLPTQSALTQSYTLLNLPAGYTCVSWSIDAVRADIGQYLSFVKGTGCTASIDYSLLPPQAGTTAIDYHLWFYIAPVGQYVSNGLATPVPSFSTLPEVGAACTVGAPAQCDPGNALVCDATTGQAVCKIPECTGQSCINSGPWMGDFVSGELQNVYAATLFALDTTNSTQSATTLASFPSIQDVQRGLLEAFPNMVAAVDPDLRLHTQSLPSDPYYPQQWDMHRIGLDSVWSQGTQNAFIKVGIVDTGVDVLHEDFAPGIFGTGRDYAICEMLGAHDECITERVCSERGQGFCSSDVSDDNGHGTHIAGTVAAIGNNGKGIAGMVQSAQIIPVKVLNRNGDTLESWAYEGIVYAVNQGAKVINFSVGGCASTPDASGNCPHTQQKISTGFKKVLDYALHRKVNVVIAAGNENDDAQWYTPANYNLSPDAAGRIIVVGATDVQDRRSSYSNYGSLVDVSAPGGDVITDRNGDGSISTLDCQVDQCILSTIPNQSGQLFSDARYESETGTSMSAPHVVGAIALMLSKNPNLTTDEVRNTIKETGDTITTDKPIGTRINVGEALGAIKEASNISFVDPQCDLCGWCDTVNTPKPADWEACHRCVFDSQGNATKKSYTVLGCFENTSTGMVQRVLAYVLAGSGGIAFLAFLGGSMVVLTSAGNPQRLQMGKDAIISSVVGLFVIVFAVFILRVVGVEVLQIPGFSR